MRHSPKEVRRLLNYAYKIKHSFFVSYSSGKELKLEAGWKREEVAD
jgi:hypothetical protein